MSFKDCIQTAIDSGRISQKKGDEGKDAFDDAFRDARAEGMSEESARLAAAHASVETMASLKADKRWQRINEMQKAHKLYTKIMESDDPARALLDLAERMEFTRRRVEGQTHALMDNVLLKYKPQVMRLAGTVDSGDDIVRAAYGGGTPEAKQMYDALASAYEWLRQRANAEGASIPENKNRRLPQTHDRLLVRGNGGKDGEIWINDHLGALDWDLMRYAGKPIAVADRRKVLEKVYWGIVTDGAADSAPAQKSQPALANRLARDRFLYYKDADSWLTMQKKYGMGNVIQQSYGMIGAMARDISLLEHMGPNPNVLKEFVKGTADLRGADLMKAGKGEWTQKVHDAIDVFESEYNIFRAHVLNSDESAMAQTMGTMRAVISTGSLGGAFLSNLNDMMTAKWSMQFNGLPQAGLIRNYARNFVTGKRSAKQAIRDAVLFESALSNTHSFARLHGPLESSRWAQRWSDTAYRAQLATHHNMTMRQVAAGQVMGYWADNAGKQFDELAAAPSMSRFGITEEDWNIFRQTPVANDRGAEFLKPQDVWRNPDSTAKEKRVADKFLDYMNMIMLMAAPERSLRTRVALKEDVPASSLGGQVLRGTFMLNGFPMEIMFNHLRKIMELKNPKDRFKQLMMFSVYLTLGGAAITQMKALAAGDNPYDMTEPKFWLKAFLNGGSAGLLGDFVFNNLGLANSELFGGPGYRAGETPVARAGEAVFKTVEAAFGELGEQLGGEEEDRKLKKKALSAALQLVPKIWYLRLLMERGITDELLQEADPAAWARKQRFHAEIAPQGQFSESGTSLADVGTPDFSTALGIE